MRHYIVNKIEHVVFDDADEVPGDIDYLYNWRHGHLGDWVIADDGCIIQIIREGKMKRPKGVNRDKGFNSHNDLS